MQNPIFTAPLFSKLGHALVALLICLAAFAWVGRNQILPDISDTKVECVSYTPFRNQETPFNEGFVAKAENIREDLIKLKPLTDCVRIYAVDQGLDQVLPIARDLNMQVLMGIWIGREAEKNELQITEGIALAKKYPQTVRSILVGNEVLLRGEQRPENLIKMIHRVKQETGLQVSYADVWEYWLKAPLLVPEVDFLTLHILPYWEDDPVPAAYGVDHVKSILARLARIYPDKKIMIGETGYPSRGRAREDAIPSPYAQALYLREFIAFANQAGLDYNLIEAFDQPWKRSSEGTVGGYWGLYDGNRLAKFSLTGPVSNYPDWKYQSALAGLLAFLLIFGRGLPGWAAGLLSVLFFLQLDHSFTAWRNWGELAVEIALALQSLALLFLSPDLTREKPVYWSIRLMPSDLPLLYLTSLVGVGAVILGQVFDPRYRDFPIFAFAIPAFFFLFHSVRPKQDYLLRWAIFLGAIFVLVHENIGNALNWHAILFACLGFIIAWPKLNPLLLLRRRTKSA